VPIERGTDDNPLIIRESRSQAQADEDRQDREDDQANRQYALWLSLITAIVVAAQVWLLMNQNRIIAGQNAIMAGQKTAADTQSGYMRDGLIETQKSSNAARRAANAARKNATAARDTLATQREIERAYISFVQTKVYVVGAEDSSGGWDRSRPQQLSVDIHIHNSGRTPGTFLGGYIGYCIGDKPRVPDLSTGQRLHAPAFLHPTEHVDFGIDVKVSEDNPQIEAALKGETPLWIVGVVDYEDRFGGLHQAGYGRKFSTTRDTLQFTPETAEWNYDRPMHPDNVRNYQEAKRHETQEARS
jgi:hypothetical protein